MNYKKILLAIALITAAAGTAVYGTRSFFSDTETSTDNTFSAGSIDLKIANKSYYNGSPSLETSWNLSDLTNQLFFNFNDLKPGDLSEDTVTLQVDTNPSWVCANITLTKDDENSVNDPENDAGDDALNGIWDGELDQELHFVFWADDGDNVLESDEVNNILLQGTPADLPHGDGNTGINYPIVDSTFNAFGSTGDPFPASTPMYIGKAWCFGALTLSPVAADQGADPTVNPGVTCSGALVSNISQTDEVSGDITFTAVQARNNPDYKCVPEKPLVCNQTALGYATAVTSSTQGKRKDGSDVLAARSNTNNALGTPDSVFYSLGFGGTITVSFADKAFPVDGLANDISIHETTGKPYPLETTKIEVSQDGVNFVEINPASNLPAGETTYLDFGSSGFLWISYVRITDTTDASLHTDDADGFDVNAVDANICTAFED